MADFHNKANDFNDPIKLPESQIQQDEWNKANKDWWENNPMRYDFSEALNKQEFTSDFFKEIDKRFFNASREFSPYINRPFEGIIDFDYIKDKSVLEIGVGNGSHAQLLSSNCLSYTGIDLTEYAVKSTRRRMELAEVMNSNILQMNAEELIFPVKSFDYIWSWGVIHHSANTLQILKQMYIVLKNDGRCTVMVYYRSHWYKYIYAGLFHGVFKGYFFRDRSLNSIIQRTIDGAIARFYRRNEWNTICESASFQVTNMRIMGAKSSIIMLPPGKIKQFISSLLPGFVSRYFTNKMRMGYFLVSDLKKMI
jgi:ubiquinone/menaquinone biosynthesis C-methylase UbiE